MKAMNKERLERLARDLRKTPPRSPREMLGGFVIAARMLDKARADLLGINGEYNYYPCGLGAYFWKFTGLDAQKFKDFVATGATDAEVDEWIRQNTTVKDKLAAIRWNNEMIGLRLCDLPDGVQEYFVTYIPQFCKPASKVKFFFDVYDVEEGVL
jgi:alkanesulfonate monooxygenase SsuD/methylene tetrahydromethanopterin reductase-like flavin-dependent oxidoreductase (luciferase family)